MGLHGGRRCGSITFPDQVKLLVSDSGVVGPGNQAVLFTEDRAGRLAQVISRRKHV